MYNIDLNRALGNKKKLLTSQQITSQNIKRPEVNDTHRRIVNSISVI